MVPGIPMVAATPYLVGIAEMTCRMPERHELLQVRFIPASGAAGLLVQSRPVRQSHGRSKVARCRFEFDLLHVR
jgi:hypothetical protein